MNILKYIKSLKSPVNNNLLRLEKDSLIDDENNVFPIINEIPRFVEAENYAESFGYQWNIFDKVQLDSFNNITLTSKRFYKNTRWDNEILKNKNLLEVGSGAGRFTEVLLKTEANLYSIDYSNAVEANYKNNKTIRDFFLAQANIYNLPFKKDFFDFILCFGVIQHTPNPRDGFFSMLNHLTAGGQIAIDVYAKNWKTAFISKYWFRPFTKKMDKQKLLNFVEWYVPKWFPISSVLIKVPYFGKFLAQIIPISNYSKLYPQLTKSELINWAILDTFDMLSPTYDNPQSLKTLLKWASEAKLTVLYCGRGDKGYVLVAKK